MRVTPAMAASLKHSAEIESTSSSSCSTAAGEGSPALFDTRTSTAGDPPVADRIRNGQLLVDLIEKLLLRRDSAFDTSPKWMEPGETVKGPDADQETLARAGGPELIAIRMGCTWVPVRVLPSFSRISRRCGFQLGMVPVLETSGYQRSGCDVNRWQVLRADQKAAS